MKRKKLSLRVALIPVMLAVALLLLIHPPQIGVTVWAQVGADKRPTSSPKKSPPKTPAKMPAKRTTTRSTRPPSPKTSVKTVSVRLTKAGQTPEPSSPTAIAHAYYDAAKAKDPAGFKDAISKASLDMMEKFAKAQNKTLDEMLKNTLSGPFGSFEAKDEKITGNTATVMVKDEKGGWETIPFVKEDGKWKIAFDKAMGGATK